MRVDYDNNLHRNYHKGRSYSPATWRVWLGVIGEFLPREGIVLDLGSGTGRFARPIAERLGVKVVGVELSERMRRVAARENSHRRVRYVAGRSEALPLRDRSVDSAFCSMALHHFADREASWREVFRVLRRGGRLFLRNAYGGRLDGYPFYGFFPAAKRADEARLPRLEVVEAELAAAGLSRIAFRCVVQRIDDSLRDHYERHCLRAVSSFEFLTEEEIREGLGALKAAAEAETTPQPVHEPVDVLVVERSACLE